MSWTITFYIILASLMAYWCLVMDAREEAERGEEEEDQDDSPRLG